MMNEATTMDLLLYDYDEITDGFGVLGTKHGNGM